MMKEIIKMIEDEIENAPYVDETEEEEEVDVRSWEQQLADAHAIVMEQHKKLNGKVVLANDIESWLDNDEATVEVVESDKAGYKACKVVFEDGVTVKVYTNRYALPEMPFDKWDESKWGFIHHTGYVEYDPENGGWFDVWEE